MVDCAVGLLKSRLEQEVPKVSSFVGKTYKTVDSHSVGLGAPSAIPAMAQTTFSVGSCALHILVCLMNSGHATSCHASAEAKLWSDRMSNFSSNIASDLDDADTTANAIIADDMTVYGDSNWMSYGYAVRRRGNAM